MKRPLCQRLSQWPAKYTFGCLTIGLKNATKRHERGVAKFTSTGQAGGRPQGVRVPGDKSISHRALILAGMATGTNKISGLLEGADVLATMRAMQALSAY